MYGPNLRLPSSGPTVAALQEELREVVRNVLQYEFIPPHPWEPEIILYGSRASGTESPTSDFDFLVELPDEFANMHGVYRQLVAARLIRSNVTTKSASTIEEDNRTVKWTDKRWSVDVSLRVTQVGDTASQLETARLLQRVYGADASTFLKASVLEVACLLRTAGVMPKDAKGRIGLLA